jgi:hypothetical protein
MLLDLNCGCAAAQDDLELVVLDCVSLPCKLENAAALVGSWSPISQLGTDTACLHGRLMVGRWAMTMHFEHFLRNDAAESQCFWHSL